jgi:hypothetical protein
MAADPAATDPGAGGKGGGKGGRGGPPVTVTDEQAKTLQPKVDVVVAAAKDLQTEAVKALGETDAPRYMMQTAMKIGRDLNPPSADKVAADKAAADKAGAADPGAGGKGGKGGGMGGPAITPTDEQLKTLTPKVTALTTAATDLNTLAKKTLSDTDGPRYTSQQVMKAVRDLNPNAFKGGKGGGGGGGGKGGA